MLLHWILSTTSWVPIAGALLAFGSFSFLRKQKKKNKKIYKQLLYTMFSSRLGLCYRWHGKPNGHFTVCGCKIVVCFLNAGGDLMKLDKCF